ncbi:hypothetical protein Adt_33559 [Abeliophyllum distichum]|uniref:Uncharacterized protein n=1 Tax=Abeliophyllum distichum TaxID=126358 RepID=A0ABD1QYK8_9LAMI
MHALPKEAQLLGHVAACSSHGAQLRSRTSPTRTRPPCSLLLPWSTASLKGLSHRLGHVATCFSHGAQLRSRASPFMTRPLCSLLLPCSTASLKGLSHWDSATLQLALPIEHSFAQGPLPLRLGHHVACSSHRAQLRLRASPTETQPPRNLLLLWSTASLKGLSHIP